MSHTFVGIRKKMVYDTGYSLALYLLLNVSIDDKSLLLNEVPSLVGRTRGLKLIDIMIEKTNTKCCQDEYESLVSLVNWTAGMTRYNRLCWDAGAEALIQFIGASIMGRYLGISGFDLSSNILYNSLAVDFAKCLSQRTVLREPFLKGLHQSLKALLRVAQEVNVCGDQLSFWD